PGRGSARREGVATMRQTEPTAHDAHAKALAVNLDPGSYGSIAEIGAGQEVARWFLTVGGASGTVAQTISAYDKSFSDATYGAGPAFAGLDPRAICLRLVRRGMTHAVVFDAAARVAEPSGVLRKRPVIINPGVFATVEPFHEAMLGASRQQLRAEGVAAEREPVTLLELSLNPAEGEAPDDAEILARVGRMAGLGAVAVTDYRELYRLTASP